MQAKRLPAPHHHHPCQHQLLPRFLPGRQKRWEWCKAEIIKITQKPSRVAPAWNPSSLSQSDLHEFKTSLIHIGSSRSFMAT